jgi:hypothetical protein
MVFEPYGTEHMLRREDRFRVVIYGDGDDVEIAYSPGCIIVWPGPDGISDLESGR